MSDTEQMQFIYDAFFFCVRVVAGSWIVIGSTLALVLFICFVKSGSTPALNGNLKVTDYSGTLETSKQHMTQVMSKSKRKRKDKRVFVIDFRGSITALRRALNTIRLVANKETDRVVLRVASGGGSVTGFGLGAAAVLSLRKLGIRVVSCIDQIAASGGYLVACCADWVIAAPFALVGSIGVVTEVPNWSRLLKAIGIDYQQLTAGALKRTLTSYTTPTVEGIQGAQAQLDRSHALFKKVVARQRPKAKMDEVGTGDHWLGEDAYLSGLVDEVKTSDDYLMEDCADCDIYELGSTGTKVSKHGFWKGLFRSSAAF